MIKRTFIVNILIIFNVFVLIVNAQIEKQKQYADSFYNNQLYFEAITEYKRLVFFDKNGDYSFLGNYQIGECYKQGAKLDEANEYFGKSLIYAKTDSQYFAAKIQMFRINLLRKTIDRAEQLLKEIENDSRFIDSTNQINYWKGWLCIFSDNWKRAAYYFSKSSYSGQLQTLCEKTDKQQYSVLKAKIFSYILPGSGQFYTGNYLSGFLSLGWTALWGYVTADAFISNRIFDGFAVGDLLLLRFYRGNIQNAEQFAVEKNIEIANKTLIYLHDNFKGIRP